ncbi:hypothetical protein BDN72DRAFT_838590 [Pluteus cervinus]|uniref:Uncharacterized protein n=1 Tax=Pluteus cervinus TaxID=181527 RepID=A0ACD3AXQ7_9AGAR|nr:hypothetical protein BDN72DRAFT_838590 [Pluteus cervinus]
MPSHLCPRLPRELERDIFSEVFHNGEKHKDVRQLLVVAKRVHEWLMPLVFTAIYVSRKDPWYQRDLWQQKLEDYGHHTRHLCLIPSWSGSETTLFLKSCPNVTNLMIWSGVEESYLEYIAKLPLSALSINVSGVDPQAFFSPQMVNQIFHKITRFNAMGVEAAWVEEYIHAETFPVLTHLAISWDNPTRENRRHPVRKTIMDRLTKTLKVLISLCSTEVPSLVFYHDPIGDDRITGFRCNLLWLWKGGTKGYGDIWAMGEGEVEQNAKCDGHCT